MSVVYVTGNAHKARYFSELVGMDIPHQKIDTPEIQSLDLIEVVTQKAKAAYVAIGQPVIVEDSSLIFHSMGKLPGTFIKWFLGEIKDTQLCRLADVTDDRSATAAAAFAYYDGENIKLFTGGLHGTIAQAPRGDSGFGWNQIFIPEGSNKTLGEMNEQDFKREYIKIKPFQAVKEFLDNLEA